MKLVKEFTEKGRESLKNQINEFLKDEFVNNEEFFNAQLEEISNADFREGFETSFEVGAKYTKSNTPYHFSFEEDDFAYFNEAEMLEMYGSKEDWEALGLEPA